jgi:hypothetical protein
MRLLANTSKSSEPCETNPIQEVYFFLTPISQPLSTILSQIVRLQTAHLPHYNAAVASSLRDGPIRGLHFAFQSLARSSNQVLLIHVRVRSINFPL